MNTTPPTFATRNAIAAELHGYVIDGRAQISGQEAHDLARHAALAIQPLAKRVAKVAEGLGYDVAHLMGDTHVVISAAMELHSIAYEMDPSLTTPEVLLTPEMHVRDAELAALAWEQGYNRGVRDAESDLEPADNPYRDE